MDGSSCQSFEYGEVFRTAKDASTFVAIVCLVVSSTDVCLICRLGDVSTCSVNTAWCRLTNQLGMSVSVEVIDHKLRIVGAGTDILP